MLESSLNYITNIERLTEKIKEQGEAIDAASQLFSDALIGGNNIFLFGTGHSHMLSEELFYRAGGLVNIHPILETSLMLHESASKSTAIERLEGYAEILFKQYGMKKGDVIVIISNSGRNGAVIDMALLAKREGLSVIALTNMEHTLSGASRHKSSKKLYELVDVVLDNCGCVGDASISLPGLKGKVGATSTVTGAMLLNAVTVGSIELCIKSSFVPDCFLSSNVDGGDVWNEKMIEKYRGEVLHL